MRGGVAVGVGSDPAVVLDGGVEGLRAVADVVAEPASVEDGGLLDMVGILPRGGKVYGIRAGRP